jgi:hypothetical protein
MVPYGTPFYTVGYVQAPMQAAAVVEHPAPEGANDDDYVDPETGEVLDNESQEFCKNAEAAAAIDAELAGYVDEEADKLQEVAGVIQQDDKKYEKAMELFREANRKFLTQKGLFQSGALRADLHAAQLGYIKTVDELRAVMDDINVDRYPLLSLKKLADDAWPDETHDDGFDNKLKIIYDSIKSKTVRYNPKAGVVRKPVAAEKRAPAPSTLADQISVQLAKEAAGAWGDM